MVRHALVPDDEYCRELVDRVLRDDIPGGEKKRGMRLGLTCLAAEMLGYPLVDCPGDTYSIVGASIRCG
jgi:hypothetical protein